MAERIMAEEAGQSPDTATTVPQAENVGVKSPIPGISLELFNTLNERHSPEFIQEQRLKYPTDEAFLEAAEKEAEHIRLTLAQKDKPTREQVIANAALPEEERLQAAENLLGSLSLEQREKLKEMHKVGEGEVGNDKQTPAGVYNYNQRQIAGKARIGAEKTETGKGVFSKEARRKLFEAGLIGVLPATDFDAFRLRISTTPLTDPKLARIAGKIIAIGDAGLADEKFLYETYARVKKLDDEAEVDIAEAQDISTELERWLSKADDDLLLPYVVRMRMEAQAQRGEDSEYSMIRERYEHYKNTNKASFPPALQVELQNRIESSSKEFQEAMKKYAFWDRSWGRIVLTGKTPEEVVRGINNFLEVATSSESSAFDPDRLFQDARGLNEEIQRVGQQVGMERWQILQEVSRSEGTLLINVADYFAVRWNVPEWLKVTGEMGRHINSRLNDVVKAYGAEVIHAADILDNDEEYDKYSRQAGFSSEESAQNDQAANAERVEIRRRLEVRIALSQLKDIDKVIREHFAGIETQIDSFGFDRSASVSATELFKNPQYLAEIEKIDDRLKALNQKYAQGLPVTAADKLTDQEKQLLSLDRIRPYRRTEDLVVIDQTDEQFRSLYIEGEKDFKTQVDILRSRLGSDGYTKQAEGFVNELNSFKSNTKDLDDLLEHLDKPDNKKIKLMILDRLFTKYIEGEQWTDVESAFIKKFVPSWNNATQAAVLAVKTRNVFFISAEKTCVSLITRHNTAEGQGELLSYNDVVRLNKFVRERAIASLPPDAAKAITSSTRNGAGLRYVDIADKLEFINLSQKVINEKGGSTKNAEDFVKNSKEALRLITLTADEKKYAEDVQAVEDIQEKVLEKLKERGSDLTASDIDEVIKQVFEADQRDREKKIKIDFASGEQRRQEQLQRAHRGEAQPRATDRYFYKDIIGREDADPQYNFSMLDDQKYSSLLLSPENKAAAYNPDHPYYYSIPATVRRVLDPDKSKLVPTGDPDVDRANAFKVQETQRRFHFAVDSVKVFGAFYSHDLYEEESIKPTVAEMVINIRNAPFIGRRMIEQRAWTLWNRGQAYRGRGFLKYLESNFRGLDHSVGRRGLRGVTAAYNGFSAKGFGYAVDFSGALDELKAELWLGQAKGADEIRPVLVGGQVGQDPEFEGILKKIIKTIGRNYHSRSQITSTSAQSPLETIAQGKWDQLEQGDYEKAIDEIEDRYKRISTYGHSLGFVGNVSQVPLAAKFSADTASRRMVYWTVAHPEAESTYHKSMDLVRVTLQPLKMHDKKTPNDYFGEGKTLFDEWQRRQFLMK